jgi:arylsulfatase A-like enzyme
MREDFRFVVMAISSAALCKRIRATSRSRFAAVASVLVTAVLGGCDEPHEPPPNLVVITLDTFRADRLGAHGHLGDLTPHLDEWARASTLFVNAVTPMGTTHPAHASLFTGLYPAAHGVRWNGDALDESFVTLAERLATRGYRTAAFVAKRSLLLRGGLDQGFEGRSDRVEVGKQRSSRHGERVNELARAWLRDASEDPFFLWLHYFDAHSPYRSHPHTPAPIGADLEIYASGISTELFMDFGTGRLPATDENRRLINALYDGEVRETDAQVAEILAELGERGLLDHAVVAIAADHGQLLGEHAEVGHGYSLWEPVLRIPFMIWRSSSAGGQVVETRVSLIDLLPTLLELLLVPIPADLPGRSLVRALRGEDLPDVPVYAGVRIPKPDEDGSLILSDPRIAVYSGPWKLVLDGEEQTLFDLASDPEEHRPVAPPRADDVRARLVPLARAYRERDGANRESGDVPDDVREELEALGYLR